MKAVSLILLMTLLLFLGAVQVFSLGQKQDVTSVGMDLGNIIPDSVDGWTCEEIPLGSSEATSESAMKMLKLDDFVQRKYSRNGQTITVYVAYWQPGKMDTRLVASHTPDRCWVENGWKCVQTRHADVLELDGLATAPAEFRVFDIEGHMSVVYYWLMVNGQLYVFGNRLNSYPEPADFLRDFFREMVKGRPEQYFVRISSSLSDESLRSEPLFRQIMECLEITGISSRTDL